ncbi:MAG: ParA family protein [Proteobacteria bacterium]|nr:ParA family protein [Pseudomonadota bacterium]
MNSGIGALRGNVVIALVSTKGGVGKTTLSGHIAVEAERRGVGPVALIDMDRQGSLSHWWNARERSTPFFVESTHSRIGSDLVRLGEMGFGLTIIDTPPAPYNIIEAAVELSDLIVMPLRAGPHDMRTLPATLSIVEPLGKPVVFVLNGATVGARITNEAVSLLSQYGPLAPVIHQRVDYAASMIDGRTAMEIKSASPAIDEMSALWAYVQRRCGQMKMSLPHQVPA